MKKISFILSLVLTMCLCLAIALPSNAATLLAHYTFDDATNLGKDTSGNGNDLTRTINADGIKTVEGHKNTAVYFGGTSGLAATDTANNDFVDKTGSGSLTVSFWAKVDAEGDGSGGMRAVDHGQCGSSDGFTNVLYKNTANGEITSLTYVAVNGSSSWWGSASNVSGDLTAWHQYKQVYDADAGTVTLYIDGAKVKEVAGTAASNTASFTFTVGGAWAQWSWFNGGNHDATMQGFIGAIDDVKVYSGVQIEDDEEDEEDDVKTCDHWYGEWSPNGKNGHSAACKRTGCGFTDWARCEMYAYQLGENTVKACPICGRVSDGARLTLVENTSAKAVTNRLPGGELVVRTGDTADGEKLLSVGFSKGGRLLKTHGRVAITLPADVLNGYAIKTAGTDGTETDIEYTVEDGKATFTVDLSKQNAAVLHLTKDESKARADSEPAAETEATLLAYYTFDDAANIGADASANGNDLIKAINEEGIEVVEGHEGNGVYFHGTSGLLPFDDANNDLIDLSGNSSLTVSFWAKVDLENAPDCMRVVDQGINGSTEGFTNVLYKNVGDNGAVSGLTYVAVVGGSDWWSSATAVSEDPAGWHHYMMVYDKDACTVTTYVDGVKGAEVYAEDETTASAFTFCVGGDWAQWDWFNGGDLSVTQQGFVGTVDDVKVISGAVHDASAVEAMK